MKRKQQVATLMVTAWFCILPTVAVVQQSDSGSPADLLKLLKAEGDRCKRHEIARQINAVDPKFPWHEEKTLIAGTINEIQSYCETSGPMEEVQFQRLSCDILLLGEIGGMEDAAIISICARQAEYISRDSFRYAGDFQGPYLTSAGLHLRSFTFTNTSHRGNTTYEADLAIERLMERHPEAGRIPLTLKMEDRVLAAQSRGDKARVIMLLDRGAPVETADSDGRTLLMWACFYGSADLVNTLLQKGADPKRRANAETLFPCVTALQCAAAGGSSDIIPILLSRGADIEEGNGHGLSPLMFAILSESETATEILVKAGANVNHRDGQGRTPLSLARDASNKKELKKILQAAGAKK